MSDVTNELFMQQTYSDTTFLERHLVGSPEYRSGAVASMDWSRSLRGGAVLVAFQPDLVVGNRLSQFSVVSSLRSPVVDRWSWSLEPTLRGGVDRSFGFDRRELGAVILGRARREMGWARDQAFEFRAGGDFLEVLSGAHDYSLSHRNAVAGVSYERAGLSPLEFRLEERTYVRTFPDSVTRDHYEQQVQASVSRDFGGLHSLVLRVGSNWRSTLYDTPSSRDRYAYYDSQAEWTLHAGLRNTLQLQGDAEWTRYAVPDSVLDFDYGIGRATARWSFQWSTSTTVSAGTRWEWLDAPWNPVERYREAAATLEFERFTLGSWIMISPAYLWRRYEVTNSGSGFDAQPTHSHFDGIELFTMFEQAIPGGLRVRSTGVGRIEWHRDSSDDARSLYFSLDVRRLF